MMRAARVAVDAVDDARAQRAADARERSCAMVQQRVDERAVRVSRRGVDDHAAGLVDHDHVRVLVHHIERNVLRHGLDRLRLGQRHGDVLAARELIAFADGSLVHRDLAALDEPRRLRAGQAVKARRKKCVEPLIFAFFTCPEPDRFMVLLPILRVGVRVDPNVVNECRDGAADHKAVRNVENRKFDERAVEHIHHIAEANAVNEISHAAADHGGQRPHAERVPHDSREQPREREHPHARHADEQPALAGKARPCRAEIAHIVQPQQLWEKGLALAHGEMGHDIGLHPLVQRDDGRDSQRAEPQRTLLHGCGTSLSSLG